MILEQAATLCFIGHAPAEYRRGLIVKADATMASSRAEREAGLVVTSGTICIGTPPHISDKDSLFVCA